MTHPAFADPVFQSQAAFRAVLRALSRPGTIVACGDELAPPAPLSPAAAAALLALAEYETPLWLAPAYAAGEVGAWLRFHTGARIGGPRDAAFALVDLSADALDLTVFAQGSAEYPDRSTTLVAEVASLSPQGPLRLSGPGVKGEARFGFSPMLSDFVEAWRDNGAAFPLGVDLILTAGAELAALPRSVRIEEGG